MFVSTLLYAGLETDGNPFTGQYTHCLLSILL
jgi:hypothetical protein